MYSTCLFCNNSLGTNESIEQFPIGRRLAFDEAKGRLWVVCKKCERWNLSPIETRWEAIEEAERAFRATKLRVSTDNIALAQLKDGTELVRIGKPPRIEFAAWRYGDQFGKRWRKYAAGTAAVTFGKYGQSGVQLLNIGNAIFLHNTGAGLAVALGIGSAFAVGGMVTETVRRKRDRLPVAVVHNDAGVPLRVSRESMDTSTLVKPQRGALPELVLRHFVAEDPSKTRTNSASGSSLPVTASATTILRGDHAMRALSTMLPHVNRLGGHSRTVRSAVDVVSEANHISDILQKAEPNWWWIKLYGAREDHVTMSQIPAALRLATEMTLHEGDERRAMEGELHELERRWKEADAIAKIADDMFLPSITKRETE